MTTVWKQCTRLALTAAVMGCLAGPAYAQGTTTPPAATQPPQDDDERRPYSRWSLTAVTGPTLVERTGLANGGQLAVRVRKGIHAALEGGWMTDVVTGSRIAEIDQYATFIQGAHGLPTTAEIDGRALFAMAGVKWTTDGPIGGATSGVRPYVIATAGTARVEYVPQFVIDGRAVSGGGVTQFGVTLGRDLLGTTFRFAYSGGAGFTFGDRWHLDLSVRVIRIHTTDHPTTVTRGFIGLGRRF